MKIINVEGSLTGEPIVLTFPVPLDINEIRMSSFTTSSPPVPLSGTFSIRARKNLQTLATYTATGHFMTLQDVLANAMGKAKVTITNHDDYKVVTYELENGKLADLDVDPRLGALYGTIPKDDGWCTITTSPNQRVNLRKTPYMFPSRTRTLTTRTRRATHGQ
jgi:hypothetical protein